MVLRHFTYSEFDCKSGVGQGEIFMDNDFLKLLDKARFVAGIPFVITSGYRTKEYNEQLIKNGYKASLIHHIVKESCRHQSRYTTKKFAIVQALLFVGITRIGIAHDFIHCDIDQEKTNKIIWTY